MPKNFKLFRDEKDSILKLSSLNDEKLKPIWVDFFRLWQKFSLQKMADKRRDPFAKALGIFADGVKSEDRCRWSVLDATCGLGQDSVRMLNYGLCVKAFERSPEIYALLNDALKRENIPSSLKEILQQRFSLCLGDVKTYLNSVEARSIDIIYFDPMYEEQKGRTALSRKEMRWFHDVVGDDEDAADVLRLALQKAKLRVVVKRPLRAEALLPDSEARVTYRYEGKSTSYDMYKVF